MNSTNSQFKFAVSNFSLSNRFLSSVLFSSLSILSIAASAGTTAYVERLEHVASDASISNNYYVHNTWGLHQPRITRHADGTIRLLYLKISSSGILTWHLMRRNPTGGWVQQASAQTTDDVTLMRNPTNDQPVVVAWPNSIPTVYTGPNLTPSTIPGSWQYIPSTGRHYGNTGMGVDGTMCIKASRDFYNGAPTANSNTEYNCGKYDSVAGKWTWSGFFSRPIGLRHAYDYLFPNPEGLPLGTLHATTTTDLHKLASDTPTMAAMYGLYVFNGIRTYSTGTNTTVSWRQTGTNKLFLSSANLTAVRSGISVAPSTMRLHESFIDSKGRTFSAYYVNDPYNSTLRGLYVSVTNAAKTRLYQAKWANLNTSGYTRIFEDSKKRLWLLWSNQGSRTTEVRLYPIIETTVNGVMKLTLGTYTNLGARFNPYSIQGNPFIAAPRGGNTKDLVVDLIFNACTTTYQAGVNFVSSKCYNSDNSGRQRVFYARIRLPD